MEDHQRYFPVVDHGGDLLPYFVCVCNTLAANMDVVRRGNERVLRARLSDARFFFTEDLRLPLEKRVEDLKRVVFQAKLGTSYEKVMRLRSLSRIVVRKLSPDAEALVDRAAFLCKADLVTGMVGEFPGLQGVMGREYALRSGEPKEVADAIYEHYLPAFAGDRLPSSVIGDSISIADKIDTIAGCLGVGLAPTGAGDPFALRRQAIGVLTILLEKGYSVSLKELIHESVELLKERLEIPPREAEDSVLEFFRQRFENLLIGRSLPHDAVEAVLVSTFDDVMDCWQRISALAEMKKSEEFRALTAAFKRVVHITRAWSCRKVVPSLLSEEAERDLYRILSEVSGRLDALLRAKDYRQALVELSRLKDPVDRFFDRVLVMDKDEKIRDNRLGLLGRIVDLFRRIADFSRITTE